MKRNWLLVREPINDVTIISTGWRRCWRPKLVAASFCILVAVPSGRVGAVAQTQPSDTLDEAAWRAAIGVDSQNGYAQYLQKYPAGLHVQDAQLALANLILKSTATATNFDGNWSTTWTCPNLGQYPGYTYQFNGQVTNGVYHGTRGVKGQPSSMVLDGKIEADGTAAFFGEIIVGSSLVGLGAPRGTPSNFHALAAFRTANAGGRRIEGRPCTLDFQRR